MKPTLDEQDITVYASDAQTIQEPFGSDYSQGVAVGKTIPAKWWNWLFRAATTRLHQAFSDLTNIFAELTNLLLDVQITPSASDNTQIAQAVAAKADTQIDVYVEKNKLQAYKYWKPTANLGMRVNSSGCLEYENGVLIHDAPKGTDAGFTYAQYSLDGGEIWHDFEAEGSRFFIPNSFVNGNYVGITSAESTISNKVTIHVMEAATVGGITLPYTYLDTIEIPMSDFSTTYNTFWTVIGTDLFFMQHYGLFIKYDSVLKKLSYTGITAADLNLPSYQSTGFTYGSCIEAQQIGGKYFVGNLMYDGTNWTNVCPTLGSTDITPVPALVRPNKVASNDKIYFTRVFKDNDYLLVNRGTPSERLKAEKVAVYDLNTGISTVLPYYTWYNQVDDVLICFKDFENNDFTLMFSYDCVNFTEIPLPFSTNNSNVVRLRNGYLLKGRFSDNVRIQLYYISGNLSDDVTKYEHRLTLSANNAWFLMVRGFVSGDISFLLSAGNSADDRRCFCVYDKGAVAEELSIDRRYVGVTGRLVAPTLRTSLMPYVKTQPFSAYGVTGYPLMVTKPTVNTVANNTLYLR